MIAIGIANKSGRQAVLRLSAASFRIRNRLRFFSAPALFSLILACLYGAHLNPGTSALLLPITCGLMLVVGLPHGIFDYLTLRKLGQTAWFGGVAIPVAVYCGAALVTWVFWQTNPSVSLAFFIFIAIVHFSEDWMRLRSRLGAISMAISMIALPALLYPAELSALLMLVGGNDAQIFSDCLRLVAPVFGLVAIAHIFIDFGEGAIGEATTNTILMIAALMLPPGIGFALYFCVFHSPMHFAEGRATLLDHAGSTNTFYGYMFVACVFVVALVVAFQPHMAMDERLIAASFQTLSILTVPHMLLSYFAGQKQMTKPY
jgi:beta-carotene 15,15'-dioxygenase